MVYSNVINMLLTLWPIMPGPKVAQRIKYEK